MVDDSLVPIATSRSAPLTTPLEIVNDPQLLASAAQGDGDALALLGIASLQLGDQTTAHERFEACTTIPHPTGLHGFAALLEAHDPDQSWVLMEEALAQGAIPALTRLARIARLRHAHAFASDLMLRAAQLGDADAMYDVAHEATDAGDDELSRRWYAAAVEREAGMEWPIQRGVGYFLL
ncbi:MAG: hypothetical protein ACR2J9_07630 [Gaiellales bacterium]